MRLVMSVKISSEILVLELRSGKEFKSSYHNPETLSFGIYPYNMVLSTRFLNRNPVNGQLLQGWRCFCFLLKCSTQLLGCSGELVSRPITMGNGD